MTTPTAVARAVARDAERHARAALEEVVAAHTALAAADTALAAATQAKADAGPALSQAILAARDVGITQTHLSELGITAPSARTLRRRRPRPSDDTPARASDDTAGGHPPHSTVATVDTPPWPHPATGHGHTDVPAGGHDVQPEADRTW